MEVGRGDSGFTVVEVVVSLIVMSVFLTLLFQLYLTSQSQQLAAKQFAVANDIAQSNLRKINSRSLIPSSAACTGSGAATTTIAWSSPNLVSESLNDTSLPSSTTQTIAVTYPYGCTSSMPAKIISTVTYGDETVVRTTYVN